MENMANTTDTIQRIAKRFFQTIQEYERNPRTGVDKFKSELCYKLTDFYNETDKLIFLIEVDRLAREYVTAHIEKAHHGIPSPKCGIDEFYSDCQYFLEQEIRELNPDFDFKVLRPNLNSDLIRQNLVELKTYPDTAKIYQDGMNKLNEGRYDRNVLDDMRLSLETLLKNVLKNSKPLEKQSQPLGEYLKTNDATTEFRNMFVLLLDYYGKYQNENVKHNDEIKQNEVEFIVNVTTAFIHCIINIKLK
jgi:hypothetical protein